MSERLYDCLQAKRRAAYDRRKAAQRAPGFALAVMAREAAVPERAAWTVAEQQLFLRGLCRRTPLAKLASELGRTPEAVHNWRSMHGWTAAAVRHVRGWQLLAIALTGDETAAALSQAELAAISPARPARALAVIVARWGLETGLERRPRPIRAVGRDLLLSHEGVRFLERAWLVAAGPRLVALRKEGSHECGGEGEGEAGGGSVSMSGPARLL